MDTTTAFGGSWCTNRRCPGSSAEVAPVVARRLAGGLRLEIATGWLRVLPGTDRAAVTRMGPVRTHAARLRFSRWRRPARVTLEVEPWSADECELVVRPRRVPAMPDRYYAASVAIVDALVGEVARLQPVGGSGDATAGLRRAS